jgi:hypothetical protein
MKSLLLLLLTCSAVAATLEAPRELMVGARLSLRLLDRGRPINGAELRVLGPARRKGTVTATPSLNLRSGPATTFGILQPLYTRETLLVTSEGADGWCSVIAPSGRAGFVSCEFLSITDFGLPLGHTDVQGQWSGDGAALVPGPLTIEAWTADGLAATVTIPVRPFEYEIREQLAAGVVYRELRLSAFQDGPFTLQLLEVDPTHPAVNLVPVRARDLAIGRETTSSLTRRHQALAGLNFGYFVTTGAYQGASAGVYQLDGRILSGGSNRSALLLCREDEDRESIAIRTMNFRGRLTSSTGASATLLGVNRNRSAQDLVQFNDALGPSTLTDNSGVEAVVSPQGIVLELRDGTGNSSIPPGGFVYSGAGAGATFLRNNSSVGARLNAELVLLPAEGQGSACDAPDILGAGPRLVQEGRVQVSVENFGHEATRNPRSALALTAAGHLLLITMDGRQPASAGVRLDEFAALLIERFDVVEALNLDGGGSTTLFAAHRLRNVPSDGVERAVSDALLLYSVVSRDDLLALTRHFAPQLEALLSDLASYAVAAERLPWPARRILPEAARGLLRQPALR